jgi:hypothetical protein
MEGDRNRRVEEDSGIFREAFTPYGLGHKDMIGNALYGTAARLDLNLLTRNDKLRKFVLEKRLKDAFISVEELDVLMRRLRRARGNHSTQLQMSHDKQDAPVSSQAIPFGGFVGEGKLSTLKASRPRRRLSPLARPLRIEILH